MQLVCLVLVVCGARALNVRITGDVSFELSAVDRALASVASVASVASAASAEQRSHGHHRARHHANTTTTTTRESADITPSATSHHTSTSSAANSTSTARPNATGASGTDCKYKPPHAKQINALLSDMMNQITKVFVRLQQYRPGPPALRHHDSRFKLANNKQTDFFDRIFGDMIKEYMSMCNESLSSAAEALRSPCANQPAVRALWSRLLDAAAAVYWRAARRCVTAGARGRGRVSRARLRHRLRRLRRRPTLRARLLHRLCADYKLCYPDLK